jgi:hypothetical protein
MLLGGLFCRYLVYFRPRLFELLFTLLFYIVQIGNVTVGKEIRKTYISDPRVID